ncbi:MAG: hypothetical protein ACE5EO_02980 [Candidatus Krumholzibacteriia bacterium]
MPNRPHPISTAFWTYLIPMTATRAMRIGLVFFVIFIAAVALLFMGGLISSWFGDHALRGMRHFLVMLMVPVGAVLLSEMPIRDGITHRTLLYPLLGPVPRATLAVVRIVVSSAILALAAGALLLLIRVLLRDGFGFLPRELLAVTLGASAYVPLFAFVHLYNRRGLVAGLAILFVFDMPLGTVPFSLRNLSPSYHVGVIASQQGTMKLPISFGHPDSSVALSALILFGIALVFMAAVAVGFSRKDLGELC